MKHYLTLCLAGACAALSSSCVGTTGGDLLELQAFGAGPSDAGNTSLRFTSSRGYVIELDRARIYVGGVYLNRARQTSVSSDTSCSLAGIYAAEVLAGLELDLLSPEPQAFPSLGFATTERALTGEVWLTNGDVNQPSSSLPVLSVSGTAERDGQRYPFEGKLTIGQNRVVPATDPSLPGQHPICKQRIVTPIPVDLQLQSHQALLLRIDPRGMFANVDFSTLEKSGDIYEFADESGADQGSDNLYAGLRRSSGVYSFTPLEKQ
jgi:hypothetical protein